MQTLSNPTLGLLLGWANESFRRDELPTLMMRCDLVDPTQGPVVWTLPDRLIAARHAAEGGDRQAHRKLLRFAQLTIDKRADHPQGMSPRHLEDLRDTLLADGYQVTFETSPLSPDNDTVRCAILPTDTVPGPPGAETSALEAELASRGYDSVLDHYRDAFDDLVNHEYPSVNEDLRTTLEDLLTRLAEDHADYQRPAKANTGTDAIRQLIQGRHIPERDGGTMLNGLWQMIQANGPHPGFTDADEARWRIQMVTATAHFLLRHFPGPT